MTMAAIRTWWFWVFLAAVTVVIVWAVAKTGGDVHSVAGAHMHT